MPDIVTTMIVSPSLGRFTFDAVFHTDHTSNVTVTQHPVQTGASISDHAYEEPDEVTVEIGMSDAMTNAESGHSVNAYTALREIMSRREPLRLITRLKTYDNMVLTSMSSPDDKSTMYALRANLIFRSVRIVDVATLSVQQSVTSSKTAGKSSSGGGGAKTAAQKTSAAKTAEPVKTTKAVEEPKTSVLKQIASKFSA